MLAYELWKDMLWRWQHRDYYHPNVAGAEETHMLSHVGTQNIIWILAI